MSQKLKPLIKDILDKLTVHELAALQEAIEAKQSEKPEETSGIPSFWEKSVKTMA